MASSGKFPEGFLWGAATSSYQVEGAANEGGREPSVWDVFAHTPGNIHNEETGDIACDQYHKYKEDVKLLSELGFKAYRFSISWSRVLPRGRGEINEEGIVYYESLVQELQKYHIIPYVTLFHWDLPQALEEEIGGWESREIPKYFAEYAEIIGERLMKKGVRHFMTINEFICFTDFGYYNNDIVFAPGRKVSRKQRNQIRHNALLSHGSAVIQLRKIAERLNINDLHIGLAENTHIATPLYESEENIIAAKKATRVLNAPFITPILEGKYLDSYLEEERNNDADWEFNEEDMCIISTPLDFIAINYYNSIAVKAIIGIDPKDIDYLIIQPQSSHPTMFSSWHKLSPDGVYWAGRFLKEIWNVKSILISENGCSCNDYIRENGEIQDLDRVMYLQLQLRAAERCTREGYPLHGYFVWSFMDNFEWREGFSKRFGVVYVDFSDSSLKRIAKDSALFMNQVITHNKLF